MASDRIIAAKAAFYRAGYMGGRVWSSGTAKAFRHGVRQAFGIAGGGLLGRTFGPLSLAMSGYQGYKEGGVWGAAKGVATDAAMWGGFNAAGHLAKVAMLNPLTIGATVAIAAGYGTYKLGQAAKQHVSGLRKLEMGKEIVDQFGTISTIRQRSLAAIQNTHINGRMGLGNEAFILSRGI